MNGSPAPARYYFLLKAKVACGDRTLLSLSFSLSRVVSAAAAAAADEGRREQYAFFGLRIDV